MTQVNDDIIGFWGNPTATGMHCHPINNFFWHLLSHNLIRFLSFLQFTVDSLRITVDWCEKNYAVTHYVAEFFNTLSSLCMVGAGAFGVYMHSQGFEKRFQVCFATIIVVGIGSILFHGTLLFSLQLFDEVPMMFCVLVLCYSVIENRKERKYGNWFPVALIIWGLAVTAIMVISGRHSHDGMMQAIEFYVFQGSFVVMAATVYLHTVAIVLNSKAGKGVTKLWTSGSAVFLIGYIGWHVDMHLCSSMYSLPFNVPNPQLHAWWHLTASYGSYLICALIAYDRSMRLGKSPKIRWIAHILPYVELPQPSLKTYSEEKDALERIPLLAAENEKESTIIREDEIRNMNDSIFAKNDATLSQKTLMREEKQNAITTNSKRRSNNNGLAQKKRLSNVEEKRGIMNWVNSIEKKFRMIIKT
ncbi:13490_t:CDS:2 [Acaulospora morrowiae]|uniref:13490_t:CDS:1 n=1 Tax=Acaulospora morrowiae TaxID=94023 RepID=A0A9N9GHP3_9GLOM|nr:13490_t:CDS:2 [Acaulospora morrowiae]